MTIQVTHALFYKLRMTQKAIVCSNSVMVFEEIILSLDY